MIPLPHVSTSNLTISLGYALTPSRLPKPTAPRVPALAVSKTLTCKNEVQLLWAYWLLEDTNDSGD